MMGDGFKKAQAGEKLQISAAAWNACLDAANANRTGQNRNRGPENRQFRQADIVLCKNTSGSDVARFGVLGIAGVIISPTDSLEAFQNDVAVTGTTPAATHKGRFVVCLEPIAAGAIGRAWISGVCQVQVDIAAAGDPFCDVIASDRTKLKSAGSGAARILYREGAGTGTKWCVVRLGDGGGAGLRIGKYTGSSTWAKHTTATIDIWENGTPPNETSSSQTIENVVNHWAAVPSGKWVGVQLGANGYYYLVVAEC